MSISTHILDTALGIPASRVPITLSFLRGSDWVLLNATTTDADGRVKHLLPAEATFAPGIYRAHFETSAYYEAQGMRGLYPYVDIVFEVAAGQSHYHVPLLLTANSYSTYRGS